MSRKLACLFLFSSSIVHCYSAHAGQKNWTEFRSPHFRVLTDGSDQDAYRVAEEFEQMRHVFEVRTPNFVLESGSPLTIFAARDLDSAKSLEPQLFKHRDDVAGLFNHGWEKQFALIRMDTF